MKLGAIIQARMSSVRFSGKSLKPMNGRPMLHYLVERLQHCDCLAEIVLATSTDPTDDELAAWGKSQGIAVHRGDLNNVAQRFVSALETQDWDAFVRVNGDSPLLDIDLIQQAWKIFQSQSCDLVTNTFPKSFPKGQSVEILRRAAFLEAAPKMTSPNDQEHVTYYCYQNPHELQIFNFHHNPDLSHLQFSVDDAIDFQQCEEMLKHMIRPHWTYGLEELVSLKQKM